MGHDNPIVKVLLLLSLSPDIDECVTGSLTCDPNALCVNTIGSSLCICNQGYGGDGITCQGMSLQTLRKMALWKFESCDSYV